LGKIKIFELAKKLKMENKDLLAMAKKAGLEVKSHLSSIEEDDAKMIKEKMKDADKDKESKKEKKDSEKKVTKKSEKSEKAEKSDKDAKSGKAEKTEKTEKNGKAGKADKASKNDKASKKANSDENDERVKTSGNVIIRREVIVEEEKPKKKTAEVNRADIGFTKQRTNQNYNIVYREKQQKPMSVAELFGLRDPKRKPKKKQRKKLRRREKLKQHVRLLRLKKQQMMKL